MSSIFKRKNKRGSGRKIHIRTVNTFITAINDKLTLLNNETVSNATMIIALMNSKKIAEELKVVDTNDTDGTFALWVLLDTFLDDVGDLYYKGGKLTIHLGIEE